MEKINRSKERITKNGEVFTPPKLVQRMLDQLDIDWSNPPQDKTFLDPTCGDGNFLYEISTRGIPIHNVYGVDLMEDNVRVCRARLLEVYGDTPENRQVLEDNIVCANALTYHYCFKDGEGLENLLQ